MTPVRVILVGMDFSPHSEAALDRAVDFARAFGARIHLLHSYAVPVRGVMPYDFTIPDGVWDGIRKAAETKLEEFRQRVVSAGVEASSEVSAERGDPGRRGRDRRRPDRDGDSGIHGSQARSPRERGGTHHSPGALLGSDGERRRASGEAAMKPTGKILSAVDFPERSSFACETLVGLAKPTSAARTVPGALPAVLTVKEVASQQ
jgi:nucleotide-binding universal stress UspA family protein